MSAFEAAAYPWAGLVPEFYVSDIQRSLRFWTELLGFCVVFERSAERFAYLELERSQVMLEQVGQVAVGTREWIVGPLEAPFGRGVNLQITVSFLEPMLARLAAADWPLFRPVEERWYATGAGEAGQRQFLVQDPDGYLLRLVQALGPR